MPNLFLKAAAFISGLIACWCIGCTILAFAKPVSSPPQNNAAGPLIINGSSQSKSGDLSIGSGLKIWLSKLGDSFALKNDSGTSFLVVGQDGNMGIGTISPDAKLEVAGQVKITGGAPAVDKLLVSDATGLGSWKTAAEIGVGGTLPAGTSGQTLRRNGTAWIGDGNLYNDGTNVGIGTTAPSAKLDLNGQIKISGAVPAANRVLTSDENGLASWQNQISTVEGAACASGNLVVGLDTNGHLKCGTQISPSGCPDNKFMKGIDFSGNIICQTLPGF